MTKKLTAKEAETLVYFTHEFSKFWEEINEKERELTRLDERKTDIQTELTQILSRINVVRDEEKKFTNKLKKKYGNFEINMETFEINPVPEEKTTSGNN